MLSTRVSRASTPDGARAARASVSGPTFRRVGAEHGMKAGGAEQGEPPEKGGAEMKPLLAVGLLIVLLVAYSPTFARDRSGEVQAPVRPDVIVEAP